MKMYFIIMMTSILMFFGSGQVMAVTQYTITDLGALGVNSNSAEAINNRGQVVIGSNTDQSFLYDGTTIKDIGTLGGSRARAFAITDSGQIVGSSYIAGDSAFHAFLYDGTTMHDLGTLGGRSSRAYEINNSGHVVGFSYFAQYISDYHAFLYDGTTMHDLGTLGGKNSIAFAINDSGQIVGRSSIAGDLATHAFLYDGTTMHDLGTLGGDYSTANAINDSGQVLGVYGHFGEYKNEHAFLYDGTTMHELGAFNAYDINNIGQVVGCRFIAEDFTDYAFLYDNGNLIDLNTLLPTGSGWILRDAIEINDSGQILGNGYINGVLHPFLMTPIPEPCTLLLLSLGGLLIRRK